VAPGWTREDNLHLTLKFSQCPVARIPALSMQSPKQLTRSIHSIWASVAAVLSSAWPSESFMDWGAQAWRQASSLHSLHGTGRSLRRRRLRAEPRSFHPHLTVARLRDAEIRERCEDHKQLGFPRRRSRFRIGFV